MAEVDLTIFWLVKCQNEVCGPYSFEQVRALVLDKRFNINDEIAPPLCRFRKIKETADFLEIVNTVYDERTESVTEAHLYSVAGLKESEVLNQIEIDEMVEVFSASILENMKAVNGEKSEENQLVSHPWHQGNFEREKEREGHEVRTILRHQKLTVFTFILLFMIIVALICRRFFF